MATPKDKRTSQVWDELKTIFDELTGIQKQIDAAYKELRLDSPNAQRRYNQVMREWAATHKRYLEALKKFNAQVRDL